MGLAHNIEDVQRTEDIKIYQDISFDTMMLTPHILNGLNSAGFYKPSPIQLLGIPLGKLGVDLLLEAKSGTGKTVVFSTIALEKLDVKKGLQVIIITPTREISVQISNVLKQIGSKCEGLKVEVVIGGLSYHDDVARLQEKVHILVGTPGRLKYLIQDKQIETSTTRLLILDEADKLMEKSFQDDIKYIHYALPKQKQVIMSSATYPENVMDVINELVQDAQHVCPSSTNVLLGVSHRFTYVAFSSNSVRQTELRFNELIKILTETQFKQCVVFCKYQARVSQLHKMLTKAKWPSELVYGKQEQAVRLAALKTLQEYKCRILISTDLVSRGIDAKNIDLVINFEPPETCETYLHRIGRSGRYGSVGLAISILSEGAEQRKFMNILEPIAHSIDIQHYWTKQSIDYKITNTIQQTSTIEPQITVCSEESSSNFNTLWELLVGENRENKEPENIVSFDQLCSSYSVPKVESFSDLIQSYGNNTENKEEIICTNNSQVEFGNIQCTEYIKTIRNLKDELVKNVTTTSADISKTNCQNDTENIKYQEHKLNSEVCQRDIETKKNSKPLLDDSKYIDTKDFISQLPKSLHKSKNNNTQKRMKQVKSIKDSSTEMIKTEKVKSKAFSKVAFQTDTTITKNKCSNHLHNSSKNMCLSKNVKENTTEKCQETFQHNTRQKTYNTWYNNLKSNMKQIEQFIYVNEMSNL